MQPKRSRQRAKKHDERGAGLVEYALLVALIAVVCITAVTFLGTSGSGKFGKASDGLNGTGGEAAVTTTTGMPTSAFACVQNPNYSWIGGQCVVTP